MATLVHRVACPRVYAPLPVLIMPNYVVRIAALLLRQCDCVELQNVDLVAVCVAEQRPRHLGRGRPGDSRPDAPEPQGVALGAVEDTVIAVPGKIRICSIPAGQE